MRKIAIFVEGQSEQVFVRHLLCLTCDLSRISFHCRKLHATGVIETPYDHASPEPEVHFLLLDAGGDGKVLSAVREREQQMFRQGFRRILALRDMYCQEYHRRSPSDIDDDVTLAFMQGAMDTVAGMSNPAGVCVHFSIMEFEAWLLGMHSVLGRLDPRLTVDHIEAALSFRLPDIDPQTSFYRPSRVLGQILQLVGSRYRKTRDDIEGICSRVQPDDIGEATANGRCAAFQAFLDDLAACLT